MKYLKVQGPYIRPSDCRKFMVLTLDNGKKSTTLYSRYLIEQKLGRELNENEIVDHINGDKYDDRIENLQIITRSENSSKYIKDNPSKQAQIITYICPVCNKEFEKYEKIANYNKYKRGCVGPFCSKHCAGKHSNGGWKKKELVMESEDIFHLK